MKTFMLALAAAILTVLPTAAFADTLRGIQTVIPPHYFQVKSKESTEWKFTDGIQVVDQDTNGEFRLFCSDLYTKTSGTFTTTGQVYHPASLADSPFHSDVQKNQLQSLFDHVYTKAFNSDYTYNDPLYSVIFQLAVWEIMNDSSDHLSMRDGDLSLTAAAVIDPATGKSYYDNAAFDKAMKTLDDWFYAIENDAWDKIGYDMDSVNLTVYLAEGGTDKSQTLIGVAMTPEPATLALFGIGLAGLAAARRRRNVIK